MSEVHRADIGIYMNILKHENNYQDSGPQIRTIRADAHRAISSHSDFLITTEVCMGYGNV